MKGGKLSPARKEGHFYDLCEQGQTKQRMGTPLTPLDFKFIFFPWWKAPEYAIDPTSVVIEEQFRKYFATLEATAGSALPQHSRLGIRRRPRRSSPT